MKHFVIGAGSSWVIEKTIIAFSKEEIVQSTWAASPLNILEKLSAELRLEPGKAAKLGFERGGMTKELLERKVVQLEQEGKSHN